MSALLDLPDAVVERRNDALYVTMNRPDQFNAITPAMLGVFESAMDQVDDDRSIRVLVLTGAGKAFCAGADLKGVEAFSDLDPALRVRRMLERSFRTFNRLEALRVPTIAAVNGMTLAGGLEILLCCDIVVADEGARLGDGHSKFAQLPGGGGTVRLAQKVGAGRAKYLMFSGDHIDARLAMEWGLVDFLAPAAGLHKMVDAMVLKFGQRSSLVLERMKFLTQSARDQSIDNGLRAELSMAEWHASSHDRNEGLAAFVGKRTPVYQGR